MSAASVISSQPSFRDELLEMLASQGNDDATAQPDAFAAIARQPQQQLARAIYDARSIRAARASRLRRLECTAATPAWHFASRT